MSLVLLHAQILDLGNGELAPDRVFHKVQRERPIKNGSDFPA